jgi:hypothetical protein
MYLAVRTTRYPRYRVLGNLYDKATPSLSTWRFARLPLHLRHPLQWSIRTTSFRLGHDYPFARVVSAPTRPSLSEEASLGQDPPQVWQTLCARLLPRRHVRRLFPMWVVLAGHAWCQKAWRPLLIDATNDTVHVVPSGTTHIIQSEQELNNSSKDAYLLRCREQEHERILMSFRWGWIDKSALIKNFNSLSVQKPVRPVYKTSLTNFQNQSDRFPKPVTPVLLGSKPTN